MTVASPTCNDSIVSIAQETNRRCQTYNAIVEDKCSDFPFAIQEHGIALDPVVLNLSPKLDKQGLLVGKKLPRSLDTLSTYQRKKKDQKNAQYPAYGCSRDTTGRNDFLSMFCALIAWWKRMYVNDMTAQLSIVAAVQKLNEILSALSTMEITEGASALQNPVQNLCSS